MATGTPSHTDLPRLLITAGPTHEPIDAVRFIGNRSSGTMGIELAIAATRLGWPTTLLLGPVPFECADTHVNTIRFETAAELGSLLDEHVPRCDCLVMGAAVADYRPVGGPVAGEKLRRSEDGLTLHLESTPDLLAGIASNRRPDQILVGFALEPQSSMLEAASAKLIRKRIDLIVANPLETMDSKMIEATLLESGPESDAGTRIVDSTAGAISKSEFASWLLSHLSSRLISPVGPTPGPAQP